MRKRRGSTVAFLAIVGVLILAGCSATHPSAVRVNSDGSVDYVTCVADADDWDAFFSAPGDDDESIALQPTGELTASSAGAVVHFSAPDREWEWLTVGASYFAWARIRSDSFTPGEWNWNTDAWFHTRARCPIDE